MSSITSDFAAPLKNSRHERFAIAVADGSSAADAYRQNYPRARRWAPAAVHSRACELRKRVQPRIDAILQARAAGTTDLRDQAIAFLRDVIFCDPSNLGAALKIAQDVTIRDGQIVGVRLPSKIAAFAELAKVLGWYAPARSESVVLRADYGEVAARLAAEIRKIGGGGVQRRARELPPPENDNA